MSKTYFLRGGSYLRYDQATDAVDTVEPPYPKALVAGWSGLAGTVFETGIEAAVNYGDGNAYVFREGTYARIDIESREVTGAPQPVAGPWPGLDTAGMAGSIDAAVTWPDKTVLFFKGDQVAVFGIDANTVTAGPVPIAERFPGLAAVGFTSGFEAVLNYGNGIAYVFRGAEYVRLDIGTGVVENGPVSIATEWTALAGAGFVDGLRGSWSKTAPFAGAGGGGGGATPATGTWLPGATVQASATAGLPHKGVPWRGVLHTTEGGNAAGAIATYKAKGDIYPHLTIDPATGEVIQHMPLDRGARAIGWGGNHNAIQIEIVGRAAESPAWDPARLEFVRGVMAQIEALVPIPPTCGVTFAPFPLPSGTHVRLDEAAWLSYSGWLGHQHVPHQDHGDPGAIDIAALLVR